MFKICKLTEIVRQSSDLEFAEILIGSDTHADDDTREITFLANIDTSHLPDNFVKSLLNKSPSRY